MGISKHQSSGRVPESRTEERDANSVPEIVALRLATVYGDESTALVSLTHRVVIADFDGEEPQEGIPHLHLTQEIEQKAGERFWGGDFQGEEEGFPGWTALFDYLDAHPYLLEDDQHKEPRQNA